MYTSWTVDPSVTTGSNDHEHTILEIIAQYEQLLNTVCKRTGLGTCEEANHIILRSLLYD